MITFILALLNQDLLPALPESGADAAVLVRLADACCGGGLRCSAVGRPTEPLATALAHAGLAAPGVTALERAALTAGCAPSLALLSFSLTRAKRLLSAADCVAALSCEALQANVTTFDAEAMDACPHKFELQAAGDLAALLARRPCAAQPAAARNAVCATISLTLRTERRRRRRAASR